MGQDKSFALVMVRYFHMRQEAFLEFILGVRWSLFSSLCLSFFGFHGFASLVRKWPCGSVTNAKTNSIPQVGFIPKWWHVRPKFAKSFYLGSGHSRHFICVAAFYRERVGELIFGGTYFLKVRRCFAGVYILAWTRGSVSVLSKLTVGLATTGQRFF